MLYMVTFTIHIPQMLAYIPYMDPMGYICCDVAGYKLISRGGLLIGPKRL
jgi:hypothetical protein